MNHPCHRLLELSPTPTSVPQGATKSAPPSRCFLGLLSLALLLFLFSQFSCASCYGKIDPITLGSFQVTFEGDPQRGTAQKPLPVPRTPLTFFLNIQALDEKGQPDNTVNTAVCIYSSRGLILKTTQRAQIKAGKASKARVLIRLAYGRTSIWVGDAGSKDGSCPDATDPTDPTRPFVGRSGAAPFLYFKNLSIREVQETDEKPYNSPMKRKYVVIDRGKIVVTGVVSNGFYVTDLEEYKKDPLGYHSLFVFTFSAPSLTYEEGVAPRLVQIGNVIQRIEGGVDEFSGHTQITFPSFEPLWKDDVREGDIISVKDSELPNPLEITTDLVWNRTKMEPYESAIAQAKNLIPLPFSADQDGWAQFRQWPVLFVEASDPSQQKACEDMIRTELQLHVDPAKNKGGTYRPCLKDCYDARLAAEKKCTPKDKTCFDKTRDGWYTCFFDCRFNKINENPPGLFARLEEKGCKHGLLLIVSSSTVPSYDPLDSKNYKKTFPFIRGILQQTKASSYYKLVPDQYPDEMSNNGFVILVRNPEDMGLKTK